MAEIENCCALDAAGEALQSRTDIYCLIWAVWRRGALWDRPRDKPGKMAYYFGYSHGEQGCQQRA